MWLWRRRLIMLCFLRMEQTRFRSDADVQASSAHRSTMQSLRLHSRAGAGSGGFAADAWGDLAVAFRSTALTVWNTTTGEVIREMSSPWGTLWGVVGGSRGGRLCSNWEPRGSRLTWQFVRAIVSLARTYERPAFERCLCVPWEPRGAVGPAARHGGCMLRRTGNSGWRTSRVSSSRRCRGASTPTVCHTTSDAIILTLRICAATERARMNLLHDARLVAPGSRAAADPVDQA